MSDKPENITTLFFQALGDIMEKKGLTDDQIKVEETTKPFTKITRVLVTATNEFIIGMEINTKKKTVTITQPSQQPEN